MNTARHARDVYSYTVPTLREWRGWGFEVSTSLRLYRPPSNRGIFHQCGNRLTISDAMIGGEALLVVACYCCAQIWLTDIPALKKDDGKPKQVADTLAVQAAQRCVKSSVE